MLNFNRFTYKSAVDGTDDWYMLHQGSRTVGIVVLHGHGSHGDQIMLRPDLEPWRNYLDELDMDVLSPNLRDNSWMSVSAVADLAALLTKLKTERKWQKIIFAAGSMGGTGALIFASIHPELADGLVVLGASTSLAAYCRWCEQPDIHPVSKPIRQAILDNYSQEDLIAHDVCLNAQRLTMPIYYRHGGADEIIPVSEARNLCTLCRNVQSFHYDEIPNGNHDSPLHFFKCSLRMLLLELKLTS